MMVGTKTFLFLTSLFIAADAFLDQMNQQICSGDIRCYNRALDCETRLGFLNLQHRMLSAFSFCRTRAVGQLFTPILQPPTSNDLFLLMSGADDQNREVTACVLATMGLWQNNQVNQAAFYYYLSGAVISVDTSTQSTFWDGISTCPAPEVGKIADFFGCVVQACVSSFAPSPAPQAQEP